MKRAIAILLMLLTVMLTGCQRGKTTVVYIDRDDGGETSHIMAPPVAPPEEETLTMTPLLPPPQLRTEPETATKAPVSENNEPEPAPEPDTKAPSAQGTDTGPENEAAEYDYVLNTNTKKFHYPSCGSVGKMSEKNKGYHTGTRDEIIAKGYSPCGNCKP